MGSEDNKAPIYMTELSVDIEADCLAVPNQNTEFADFEMWMETGDTSSNPSSNSGLYWIEEGLDDGTVNDNSANTNFTGFQWFWADFRPSGGYNEHHISWASEKQRQTMGFAYLGPETWEIEVNGSSVAREGGEADDAGGTALGAELAVDTEGQVAGHAWNWKYMNGGAWAPVSPALVIKRTTPPPTWSTGLSVSPTDVTVKTPNDPCGMAPQSVPPTTLQSAGESPLTAVRRIAVTALASHATGHATSMTTVRSTREAANKLYGSTITGSAGHAPVYLVQALGSFTASASSPRGTREAIKGGAMTFVIDVKTGTLLDWGIQPHAVKLQSLGKTAVLQS
jgi:hypothetical protein